MKLLKLTRRMRNAYTDWSVDGRMDRLEGDFEKRIRGELADEDYDHSEIVNHYYDLSHEVMEYGWGDSLHFAPMKDNETLEQAVVRHQRLMIQKLDLKENMLVIDVGCGVGGPMRRVAKESGAKVYGINNNEYQLNQAKLRNIEAGLDHLAEYLKCDLMDMHALESSTFDAGYAIESTCHAADKHRAFAEIFRVLKPGALLWGQEMCLTDKFDESNSYHQELKEELMRGISLKDIASFSMVNSTLESVGFEVLEATDRGALSNSPTRWYSPMASRHGSVGNLFRRSPTGRVLIDWTVRLTESIGLFPQHSHRVIQFLDRAAEAYVNGGREGVFTPLYCFLARKPD